MNKLFLLSVKYREHIITLFKLFYIAVIVLCLIATRSLYYGGDHAEGFYELGKKFGELAILFYVLTVIPGIARRFHINHKLISILMMYRRYIGIAMYALVFYHFWTVRGVDWTLRGQLHLPFELFEIAGIIAGIILTFLVMTSNDWSTKHLGVWWGRIHALTYAVCWIIFIHVVLQKGWLSPWSLLLIGTSLLLLISHLFVWVKRRYN